MEVLSFQLPDIPAPSIKCELTFEPYLKYIEQQTLTTNSKIYKTYLESITSLIYAHPELSKSITNWDILENHKELSELLKITHLSQVEGDSKLHAFGLPNTATKTMNYFSWSDEFKDSFNNKSEFLRPYTVDDTEEMFRELYIELLAACYPNTLHNEISPQAEFQFIDESGKIKQYYKIVRRSNFAEIVPDGNLPEFKQEWADYANGIIQSQDELEESIPFNQFTVRGFYTFSVIENTEEIALHELSHTAAQMHNYNHLISYKKVKEASLSLFNVEHLEIGFIPFLQVNEDYVYHDGFADTSIVFSRLKKHLSTQQLQEGFNYLSDLSTPQSNLFSTICSDDTSGCEEEDIIKKILSNEGLNNLTLVPVKHQDRVYGVIELGSSLKDDIDGSILNKISKASPFYREYFVFNTMQFEDALKSFIMQRYTSILPSVFWKFNEEVWKAFSKMTNEDEMPKITTPDIQFQDLQPFYGAVDYRNSSVKQLQAIHSDFLLQLDYLKTILLEEALLKNVEVARFVSDIDKWEEHVKAGMNIEDEYELRDFLDTQAIKLLLHLLKEGLLDQKVYDNYQKSAIAKDGIFHLSHRDYEDSLQTLNRVLKTVLNSAESTLQDQVPHYFEKFQTDGIEYSMYAGKSIAPKKDFPNNAADIIAEWQIDTMLSMAKAAAAHKNKLSIPLETTQLILIHENKVDISYRIDEKHFDVEGSYSIRYEVMKKRIDKVKLLDSSERLTQPNTIAIVYAHKKSYKPYLQRIKQLVKDGAIKENIEYLDLEQLHGVGKLKAIRIHINNNVKSTKTEVLTSQQA